MAKIHMAEAADFFRDGGEANREVMVFARELCKHLVEHRFVFRIGVIVVMHLDLQAALY